MKSILEFLTPKKATFFINSKSTLRQVVEKFYAHRFTVVPLVDDNGKYVGTISQGDVLRFIKERNDLSIESLEDVGVMDIEHYRSWQSSLRVVPAGLYIQLTAICPSMEQVRFALPRLDIRVVAFLVRFLPAVLQYERINSVCSHERTVQVEHGAFSQWLPPTDGR